MERPGGGRYSPSGNRNRPRWRARWRRALPEWRRQYRRRNRATCRRRRIGRPGIAGSRGLGTLPFREPGNAAAALGAQHLLDVFFRVLAAARSRERRQCLAFDELHYLVAIQDLALQQRLGDLGERFGPLIDDGGGRVVAALHQLLHLLVDTDGGFFAVIAVLGDFTAQEDLLFLLA